MPLDAPLLSALCDELNNEVSGLKIDRISQPERDEIVLGLRGRGKSVKLLLSASPQYARASVIESAKENPKTPPMFCMLLRKKLGGAILRGVCQPSLERLLIFTIDALDELQNRTEFRLIIELIGRQSNLVLVDNEERIVDAVRRVDSENFEKRQILPGRFYELPPPQEKRDPRLTGAAEIIDLVKSAPADLTADRFLVDNFFGISPLVAREIAFRAVGDVSGHIGAWDEAAALSFSETAAGVFKDIANKRFQPVLLTRGGRPFDLSYLEISQYGAGMELKKYPGASKLIEDFFSSRDRGDRMRQRTQELTRTVKTLLARAERKLNIQREEMKAAKNREEFRRKGDLLMANLGRVPPGAASIRVEDFYSEEGAEIEIALQKKLSAQQNAAKYYKDYSRLKAAEKILGERILEGESEVEYLLSVLEALSRAESAADVLEIREELKNAGSLRRENTKTKEKTRRSEPMEFRSSTGFFIRVGRNNLQNDALTLKDSARDDIFFHARQAPGSHVVLRCEGNEPDLETYTEAAVIAAYYSSLREGENVAVDYTRVKFVKKPPGARPGKVIYNPYYTAYATPDEKLVERLRAK